MILAYCTMMSVAVLSGCGNTKQAENSTETSAQETFTVADNTVAESETDTQAEEAPMGPPPAVDTGVKRGDGSPVMDRFAFFAYQGDDALPHEFHNVEDGQKVYFTKDISPEGLVNIYEVLGVNLGGKVAVKLSTGENDSNYLDPQLIKDLVQSVNGTIVECNTAYGGNRSETAMHKQLVKDHGFTELVLSHFKGHPQGGFGGAIKNISIGLGSGARDLYLVLF